ncbi:prepilin-type N-terminal cleavage/methylation domain-containing protein [Chthoniobacter flavus]|nr:prepilin-type N-terminal cleavage/methylation domain-containing protein [Chthoniobacter flavus]
MLLRRVHWETVKPVKFELLLLLAVVCAVSARADVITLPASKDASIVKGNPDNNNGGGPCFFSGTDGNSSPHRALIAWQNRAITAFTLIELLIVIAIIAILAGIVMGVLGPVSAARDQTRSASNMRQWGVALAAYANDNDGYIPRRGQGVQPVMQLNRPEDWFNALPPYLGLQAYGDLVAAGKRPHAGDNSIFVRPGAKDPGGTAFLSYGMNMNLSPWDLTQATKLNLVSQPSLVVFLAETPGQYASTYPSKRAYSCQAPYRNQGNILFLDGHVSAYSATYIGVNKGDPHRPDISWLTGTASDAQAGQY